jgi:hypothetical protein
MSVPASAVNGDMAAAVDQGIELGNGNEIPKAEEDAVKSTWKEFQTARDFDKPARDQYAKDRKYAQGNADPAWASDANIIGAFIDILTSFLYAQNPDVSARPAPRAGGTPDPDMADFAETVQIVDSHLWKKGKLKKAMKRVVRSVLSVGPGWFKSYAYSEKGRNPLLEKELGDARDNLKRVQALKDDLTSDMPEDQRAEKEQELQDQVLGLVSKTELLVKRGLCIDFVRAEDMQVSLDVANIADYVDADWVSNIMYVRKDGLKAMFTEETVDPITGMATSACRLTDEDIKSATVYYQRQTSISPQNNVIVPNDVVAVTEGQFAKAVDNPGLGSTMKTGAKPVEFVMVVEMWSRKENINKTLVDGVKRWPREPYPPTYATTRFYPYFYFEFYPVDGTRHPQSLSSREAKMQDEYSQARSALRLNRERSIPGVIFNRGGLDPEDVMKIEKSVAQEWTGVQPTDPSMPLDKLVTGKPMGRVDLALLDTKPILYDMNVLSGVQEAQASGASNADTATEAEIQQSGFASRTGADRDALEEVLTDFAQYTTELAVQCLPGEEVKRIAGPLAFWPEGMDTQDILTMVEVEVQAGTTGKPQARADKEAWATLMPLIQQMGTQIPMMEASGNPAMMGQAKFLRALLRETLKRLDDRLSIDQFLPPPAVPILPSAPAVGAPPVPGAPVGPVDPTAAATDPTLAMGTPPVGNGTINNPQPPPAGV